MQLLSLQKTMIYDLIVKKGFSPANSIGHLIFFFWRYHEYHYCVIYHSRQC